METITRSERQRTVINQTRKDHLARFHEEQERIAGLVAKLAAPHAGLPETNRGNGTIIWTKPERDIIFDGVRTVVNNYFPEVFSLDENKRNAAMLTLIRAVVKRLLPSHRYREVHGWQFISNQDWQRYAEFFKLPLPSYIKRRMSGPSAEESTPGPTPTPQAATPAPEPAPVLVPPVSPSESFKAVTWTKQERESILLHLCHLLQSKGIGQIPEPSDRVGSMMLGDDIRIAQEQALPRHRRRDLSHARAAFMDMDLMPELEAMLKRPRLPAAPAKGPEMEELVAMKPPARVETNGRHHANGNGHHPELKPEPRPQPAQQDGLEARKFMEDAQTMLKAFKEANAHLNAMLDRMTEIEQMNQLLTEENAGINRRMGTQAAELSNLRDEIRELKGAKVIKEKLPRVAILGCRKDEFEAVVKKAGENGLDLDFRHYEQQREKVLPVHADYAIMMPGLDHAQAYAVEKAVPRGQYVYLSNFSVTKSIAYLLAWFNPAAATA